MFVFPKNTQAVDPVTRAPEQERRIRDAWVKALAFALQRQHQVGGVGGGDG